MLTKRSNQRGRHRGMSKQVPDVCESAGCDRKHQVEKAFWSLGEESVNAKEQKILSVGEFFVIQKFFTFYAEQLDGHAAGIALDVVSSTTNRSQCSGIRIPDQGRK